MSCRSPKSRRRLRARASALTAARAVRGERVVPAMEQRCVAAAQRRCGGPRPRPVAIDRRPVSIAGAGDPGGSRTSHRTCGDAETIHDAASSCSSSPSEANAAFIAMLASRASRSDDDDGPSGWPGNAGSASTRAPALRAETNRSKVAERSLLTPRPAAFVVVPAASTNSASPMLINSCTNRRTRTRLRVSEDSENSAVARCGSGATRCL